MSTPENLSILLSDGTVVTTDLFAEDRDPMDAVESLTEFLNRTSPAPSFGGRINGIYGPIILNPAHIVAVWHTNDDPEVNR